MKRWIVFIVIILSVVTAIYFIDAKINKFRSIHNVDDLHNKIADEDFDSLKDLEREFCNICQSPYGGSYENRLTECKDVVQTRKEITKKYTDHNILYWQCHASGECDVGQKKF